MFTKTKNTKKLRLLMYLLVAIFGITSCSTDDRVEILDDISEEKKVTESIHDPETIFIDMTDLQDRLLEDGSLDVTFDVNPEEKTITRSVESPDGQIVSRSSTQIQTYSLSRGRSIVVYCVAPYAFRNGGRVRFSIQPKTKSGRCGEEYYRLPNGYTIGYTGNGYDYQKIHDLVTTDYTYHELYYDTRGCRNTRTEYEKSQYVNDVDMVNYIGAGVKLTNPWYESRKKFTVKMQIMN